MSGPTRIVILGGGFGGVYTALELEKLIGRDPNVEIATARCATRVDVLAVDRDAFNARFATLPPLRGFFQQIIAERLGAGESDRAEITR